MAANNNDQGNKAGEMLPVPATFRHSPATSNLFDIISYYESTC